ncbi:MAG: hypothetical protein MUC60_06555 [Oscillatoria sp. Prado101]|nr:hypothetical protein [Oscillatoria sp. Prado101]
MTTDSHRRPVLTCLKIVLSYRPPKHPKPLWNSRTCRASNSSAVAVAAVLTVCYYQQEFQESELNTEP